jgi:DNA-binding response OmpR family regulator/HPt (histidine-containing phosphotransfer) domain-containing protein
VKILFVEDDEHTCELISATLEAHRYAVDVVNDGEAGLEMAIQWPYDLILLDVMLPKLNGIEVCRQLRSRDCQTPILILTGRGASEDVITGLDAGADDYVVKSCKAEQLMARVRALLRRGREATSNPLLCWGELCLDPSLAQVTFKQTTVPCRPKEYTLLELFLRNPQRLFSRNGIIDHLWAYDDAPVEGSVTTLVKDLRRRLKAAGVEPDPIETVYGLGYRLKPDPQVGAWPRSVDLSHRGAEPDPASVSKLWGEQRVKDVMQRMDAKFQTSWSGRIAVLEAAVQSLQAGDFKREQQQAALESVHKLVGGLGTFGYDRAAALAETLEESLMQHLQQEAQWASQFAEILGELKQNLSQQAESFPGESVEVGMSQD